ncbi:P-loop containing nucleoside triphosphate hydrolase protein [Ochromonadaceae sp. CCMP2298]|nr:P-loop containing nucleoside triphosphate hydrolase protein [Ochromonadaceae sp. CCMP2298]
MFAVVGRLAAVGRLGKSQVLGSSSSTSTHRYLRTTAKRLLPVPKFEKRLDVVILGAPNAGKSVLLNRMVQSRIAATSRKRHTTRTEILGVFNYRNTQLAFYDTPGYVRRADALKADAQALSDTAATSAGKADVVLLVVDAARCESPKFHDAFAEMVKIAQENAKKEIILVLNKVDMVEPKRKLLDITRTMVSLLDTTTFMISALQDDGLIDIKNYLIGIADMKSWILPAEEGISGASLQQRVEEMVLEQLLDHTHDEIPYICDLECTTIVPVSRTGGRVKVEVNIWVDTPSQQRIIVGQQGRTLVKVRQAAVAALEEIMGKEVILMLWVKLRKEKTRNTRQSMDQ